MSDNNGNNNNLLWQLMQKLLALLTIWLIFFLGIAPVHEYGHVMATRIMGGDAYVSYTTGWLPTGAFTNFTTAPTHGLWFVYFAGGFTVFLAYMLLWFWAWRSKTLWDMCIELPVLTIALWQIVYAFMEAFIYPANQELFSLITASPYKVWSYSTLFGLLAGVCIEAKRLWRWLTTREDIIRKELYW